MFKKRRVYRAQAMSESVVLIAVVITALMLMAAYMKRGYCGRIKADADTISQQQYSPFHTTSDIITEVENNSQSWTGGIMPDGTVVPDGVTVTQSDITNTFNRREAIDAFALEDF
ncbi:hypothetical protein ACFL38_01995 [Candidatus Omnitrophota bacterium]